MAFVDTGINPYHVEFRDNSSLAYVHPSKYIPGYPPDTPALPLTLNASSLSEALEKDRSVWSNVTRGRLYWVPGTRIVGLYADPSSTEGLPGFDEEGHGTMVASRGAGRTTGSCPECRIVAIEGISDASLRFVGTLPWVDVVSNSWTLLPALGPLSADRDLVESVAKSGVLLFFAAGNGVGGVLGVAGEPTWIRDPAGLAGVVAVGAHDNGYVTPWSGSFPHVASDGCGGPSAVHDSIEKITLEASGTSSATPFAAGEVGRIILEARKLLGDPLVHHSEGVFANSSGSEKLPDGPLSDGKLTREEVLRILFHTADPRPRPTPHDGRDCMGEVSAYPSGPLRLSDLPDESSAYYFVGYGVINDDTLQRAWEVLSGKIPEPSRPQADEIYGLDQTLRQAKIGLP